MRKLLLLLLLHISIFAYEVRECTIQDMAKHRENQKLLQSIVIEQKNIHKIGAELLQRGFHADAYAVPKLDRHSVIAFNCFTLWEGKDRPITYFVYIWPSEELAKKYIPEGPDNCFYASNIHSHPISCAFTILQGTITQKNYEPISKGSKVVKMTGQQTFSVGTGEVDAADSPFIHQLCNESSETCISLHAYGEPTAKKVMETFEQTAPKHTFQQAE